MNSSSSSDEEVEATPEFLKDDASAALEFLLPERSRYKYLKTYEQFIKWRTEKGLKTLEESVFITYFKELSEIRKPSSLWSIYSMLKTTVYSKHDVNMKYYLKLVSFLKQKSIGFKSKKSEIFSAQEIETFIFEAPDDSYLDLKVVLIIGLSGACKIKDLMNITLENIEKYEHEKYDTFVLKLPIPKTESYRNIEIRQEYSKYIQTYIDLRPPDLEKNRFFVNYRKGQCYRQFIGKNKMASMPSQIAEYLKLPNPKQYTGFCFRRTALKHEKTGGLKSKACDKCLEGSSDNRTQKEETSSSKQKQPELQQMRTSKNAQKIEWEMNEPIAFEQVDIKEEMLPVIETTESINTDVSNQPVSTITKTHVDKCFKQVCNLLGLNAKLSLPEIKKEVRLKTTKSTPVSIKTTNEEVNCTSIFISHMPLWFKFFHVKALVQLMSDFDVESDSYYIDMLKNSANESTGECLLRFVKRKDCLQVYKDLQGVDLGDGPIIVNLDLDNAIADERDRHNPEFEEHLRKYNEARARYKECCEQELEISTDNRTVIKEEIQEDDDQDNTYAVEIEDANLNEVSVKSEICEYSAEIEYYENTTTEEQESVIGNETNLCELTSEPGRITRVVTNEEIYQQIEENVRDKRIQDEPDSNNENDDYNTCKIVHIKNVPAQNLCNSINIMWEKIGNMQFKFFPVFDEETKAATNVLLSFSTHEDAKNACYLLNGLTVLGSEIDASMGVGYRCKGKVTFKDLRNFQRKKKLIYLKNRDRDRENEQPAKRARTDDSQSSGVDYTTGHMIPEPRNEDTFGLSREYAWRLGLKAPFTRKLIVSELHPNVTETKLFEVFSLAGDVKKIQFYNTTENNLQRAKVEYDHPLEAIQAISMFHNHKLYNQVMRVRMDWSRATIPLPQGLESVGQGLGSYGEPLRGLRIQAELIKVYESLIDLGAMEIVPVKKYTPFLSRKKRPVPDPNSIPAFKFTYMRKRRRPMRPYNSNSKPSNVQSSRRQTSPQINYKTLQNVLSTLPNTNKNVNPAPQPLNLPQPTNSNVNVTQQNPVISALPQLITPTNYNISSAPAKPVISAPNVINPQVETTNTDPLDVAINRVLEFMTPNTVTLNMVQSNLTQSFHNPVSTQPVTQLPASSTTHTLSPLPGCSKDMDFRLSRNTEEDYRQSSRNDDLHSRHNRESSEKDTWMRRDSQRKRSAERDVRRRKRSVEKDALQRESKEDSKRQRKNSVERNLRLKNESEERDIRRRKRSVEKDALQRESIEDLKRQRKSSVERTLRSRNESVERDIRRRNRSVERDPWQRESMEDSKRQRKNSVERDSRPRNGSEERDIRRRNRSVERDPWQSESIEDSKRQRKNSVERDSRPRDGSEERDYRERRDSRQRRDSIESYSRNRCDSEERESRHRYYKERSSQRYRHRSSDDEGSSYSRYSEERCSRRRGGGEKYSGSEYDEEDTRTRSYNERDKYKFNKKSSMLVFKNLPPSVSKTTLSQKMCEVGEVLMCELTDAGRAFLKFKDPQDADKCIRLFNNSKVDKQVIEVRYL